MQQIYVETDTCGQLRVPRGAARAARRMSLAPAAPHATAMLCLDAPSHPGHHTTSADDPRLSLRLVADVPPLHELHLWFDEHTLAHLDMPFLTLRNITGNHFAIFAFSRCIIQYTPNEN